MNIVEASRKVGEGEMYRISQAKNGTLMYLHFWEAEGWQKNFGELILGSRTRTEITITKEDLLADDWEVCEYGKNPHAAKWRR